MACPKQYVPNIHQFDPDHETFWMSFVAKHPPKPGETQVAREISLNSLFDEKYAKCFAKLAGSGLNLYDLPHDVKKKIRADMLT
jgi:hypothetical protein